MGLSGALNADAISSWEQFNLRPSSKEGVGPLFWILKAERCRGCRLIFLGPARRGGIKLMIY